MALETSAGRGGVLTHYGTRAVDESHGGETAGESGIERVVEYLFDYDDLPAYGATSLEHVLPAGARVLEATCDVLVAFTSTSTTTDLSVGLYKDDGSATYDEDGLLTAAQLTQTVIGTLVRTTGTGAVVNGVPLTEACQLYVTPSDTDLLTGKAKVTIKYASKAAEAALY